MLRPLARPRTKYAKVLLSNIIYNAGFKIQPVNRFFFCKLSRKNISCTPCTRKIIFLNALNRVCPQAAQTLWEFVGL